VRAWIAAVIALAVLGGLGAVLSAAALQDGVREIPRHWWSTLATLPLLAAALLAALPFLHLRA
jgi:hypothetical protein